MSRLFELQHILKLDATVTAHLAMRRFASFKLRRQERHGCLRKCSSFVFAQQDLLEAVMGITRSPEASWMNATFVGAQTRYATRADLSKHR